MTDADQLAADIQAWQDAQWCFPLNTKPPNRSTNQLAEHLRSLGYRDPDPLHTAMRHQTPCNVPDLKDE